ncbi:MAG: hypothetical protein KDA28_06530, partial [Phycisphaerales bacterium]|nr:hypothetical protein [Phycisphaerales bacterium]
MIPIEAEGLADALRDVMEQDHDRVLEEYLEEHGRFDPLAWLAHLERWELAPVDLIAQLRSERSV